MANRNARCIHRSKKKIGTCKCAEGSCSCGMKTPIYQCAKLGVSCTIGKCTNNAVAANCKTCKFAEVPELVAITKPMLRKPVIKSGRQVLASRRGAFLAIFRKDPPKPPQTTGETDAPPAAPAL